MRVLICGSRHWNDAAAIRRVLIELKDEIEVLIEGEAEGADMLARIEAEKLGIKVLPYEADWDKYGRAAGPIRNSAMLTKGQPNVVIAFHENLFESHGTLDMVKRALRQGISIRIYGTSVKELKHAESR